MLETLSEELKHTRAFEQEMRKFAAIVSANPAILNRLSAAVDEGISREGFRDLYVACGAEHGATFTSEQLEIAMQEQKQGKDKILPSAVQKLVTIL